MRPTTKPTAYPPNLLYDLKKCHSKQLNSCQYTHLKKWLYLQFKEREVYRILFIAKLLCPLMGNKKSVIWLCYNVTLLRDINMILLRMFSGFVLAFGLRTGCIGLLLPLTYSVLFFTVFFLVNIKFCFYEKVLRLPTGMWIAQCYIG